MIMYLLLAMVPIMFTPIVNSIYKSSIRTDERAKRTFLLCCGVCLFIMIAFRSQYVGSIDSERYYQNWSTMRIIPQALLKDSIANSEMEPGYLVAVWLLSRLFPNPQMLFVLTGILFTVSVCRFIYKNSDDVFLSFIMFVCLGIYSFMVQGLRQAIAMSICLFAFEYCKNKKFFKFVLLVLFASLFHKSAVLFLVVYLINIIGFNLWSLVLVVVGSGTFVALSGTIAYYANIIFGESYTVTAEGGGFVALAIYLLILGLALFFVKKNNTNREFILAFYLTYIGLMCFILRYREFAIADRVNYYFIFGQIILLPKIISHFDGKIRFVMNSVVSILCIILFAYRLSTSDLIPFEFFWQSY